MAKHFRKIFWTAFLTLSAFCIVASYSVRYSAERKVTAQAVGARADAQRIQEEVILFTQRIIPSRVSFASMLQEIGRAHV